MDRCFRAEYMRACHGIEVEPANGALGDLVVLASIPAERSVTSTAPVRDEPVG